MTAISNPPKAPRGRLAWITRYDAPFRYEIGGPRYLLIPALLAVLLLIVVLGIATGSAAAEFFSLYSSWLKSLAAPTTGTPFGG